MLRVAQSKPAQLRIEVRTFDGDLATPTAAPQVTIADASGATVQTGTGTADPTTTGVYLLALNSAVTGTLGDYTATATWTRDSVQDRQITHLQTVSAHLFELPEFRAHDPGIADPDLYPAYLLRDARDKATDRLERAAKVAFTHRSRVVSGRVETDLGSLLLPDAYIESVAVWADGVELDDDQYRVVWRTGELIAEDGPWPSGTDLQVEYTYGMSAQPAGPVSRAAMLLALEYLIPSQLPARATSQSTDLGDFRISVADPSMYQWTGIPEVDAVIAEYGMNRPPTGGVLWR